MNFIKWIESKKYLPKFLRDFHDQKDLFKVMQVKFVEKQWDSKFEETPTFQQCQIITEFFLMFMAAHGYTLQKTKTKVECSFDNVQDTIDNFKKEQLNAIMRTTTKQELQ